MGASTTKKGLAGEFYRFGPFEFDPHSKVLFRSGRPVKLTTKTAETLLVLIENAGRVLTKDDLITAIWGDRAVNDANLPQHISLLRKSLARDEENREYIVTFPGRGYQFAAPVERVSAAPAEEPAPRRGVIARRALWVSLAAVAALIVAAWFALPRPQPAKEPLRTPLVRLPGAKSHPAVSPDGTKIAFVWDRRSNGLACIHIHDSRTGETRELEATCGDPSSPAWSPEGHRLAYIDRRPGHSAVTLVEPAKPQPVLLAKVFPIGGLVRNRLLDWSPDGRHLVVSDKTSNSEPLALYLVSVETGAKTRLTEYSRQYYVIGDIEPRFSRDGRHVAFTRMLSRRWCDIATVSLETRATRIAATKQSQVGALDWGLNDETILFSAKRTNDYRLLRVPANGSGAVSPDPSGLFGDNPISFSFHHGARVLAYVVSGDDLNIWRVRLDGAPRWESLIASSGEDTAPQYSPDGSRIVFLSDRSGKEQLWLADAEGRQLQQLTAGDLRPGIARWSADGKNVVFNSFDRKTLILPVAGGSPRQVAVQPRMSLASFTPDGSSLVGTLTIKGRPELIRAAVSGGPARQITTDGGYFHRIDGGTIYFTRDRMAETLWSMPLAGGEARQVLAGMLPGHFGSWAAGASEIYFVKTNEKETPVLAAASRTTGAVRVIGGIPHPLPPFEASHAALSPDEKSLLLVLREAVSNDLMQMRLVE